MAVDTKRDEQLVAKYVEPDPHKSGRANARVKDNGTHIWAVISHLQGTNWDVADAMRAYRLSREMVEAAEAYYRRNREYIDAKLLLMRDDA